MFQVLALISSWVFAHQAEWKLQLEVNYVLSLKWEEVDPKSKESGLSQAVDAMQEMREMSKLWPAWKGPRTQHHLFSQEGGNNKLLFFLTFSFILFFYILFGWANTSSIDKCPRRNVQIITPL